MSATGGNFIVTAEHPAGTVVGSLLSGRRCSRGSIPACFFDEDGRCYYCGTQTESGWSKRYNGDWEIWVQELDLIGR